MKKGFTIIEILIAMLILFTAIGFVNISIKAFNNYQRKSEVYQNFYITALSIKDFLKTKDMSKQIYRGEINNIKYIAKVIPFIQAKNYDESMLAQGNIGDFMITLYKIDLTLLTKTKRLNFSYFLTKQKNLKPKIKESFY